MTTARIEPPALIATISAGYGLVTRRLWVLLIPVALDLGLWLTPPILFAPFLRLLRGLLRQVAMLAATTARQQEQLIVQMLNTDIRSLLAGLSLVPVLLPQVSSIADPQRQPVIYIGSPFGVASTLLIGAVLALLSSSLFLSSLARRLDNQRATLADHARHTLVATLSIGGYLLLLLGAGALLSSPVLLLMLAIAPYAPTLVALIGAVWLFLAFWAYIYIGFAIEAIVIDRIDPLRAILRSIHIVRHFFMGALGLVLLSLVISAGMVAIWSTLVSSLPGLLVAILGNAYIGSGLAAARLVFYRERWAIAPRPDHHGPPEEHKGETNIL